jgi:hypothetical protein
MVAVIAMMPVVVRLLYVARFNDVACAHDERS